MLNSVLSQHIEGAAFDLLRRRKSDLSLRQVMEIDLLLDSHLSSMLNESVFVWSELVKEIEFGQQFTFGVAIPFAARLNDAEKIRTLATLAERFSAESAFLESAAHIDSEVAEKVAAQLVDDSNILLRSFGKDKPSFTTAWCRSSAKASGRSKRRMRA